MSSPTTSKRHSYDAEEIYAEADQPCSSSAKFGIRGRIGEDEEEGEEEEIILSDSYESEDEYQQPKKPKGKWWHGKRAMDEESEEEEENEHHEDEEENEGEEEEEGSIASSDHNPRRKRKTALRIYDPYEKIELGSLTNASKEALKRAVEYMQLYCDRYASWQISKDSARRMLFAARLHGAPSFAQLTVSPHIRCNLFYLGDIPHFHSKPINLKRFFGAMDQLEGRVGLQEWDLFYISGPHFLGKRKRTHFAHAHYYRTQILNILRTLHKATMHRDWPMASECIAKIPLLHPKFHQRNSRDHFGYLARTLNPYLPSIYLTALQCLLESRQPIDALSRQFAATFHAFLATCVKQHSCIDNSIFFFSQLLTFHLVNLHLERPKHGEEDVLATANQMIKLHGTAERRRVIVLLSYCIDVERHLLELSQMSGKKQKKEDQIQDRSLANFFPQFLSTLFENPRDAVGLLPLAIWGAQQFDCMNELTEKLLEECARYPYLLIHVYNVLARFQLEHVAGQLLAQLFDLSVELLSTTQFILDLIEQRSIDPASYGQFDGVVSGNLRALFMYLDYGRNRADERAWALLYSNICYIKDNDELMGALVRPRWEKRKSWWPKFHDSRRVQMEGRAAEMREETFQLLNG